MYRLMVNVKGHWKVGIRTYDSLEDAELRVNELKSVGIEANPVTEDSILN